jgi:hypothetical protein
VEAQDMAHFKKKPESLMPISPFWMKAAFCLYRTSAKPGLPRAAHRSFATATGVIKSRLPIPTKKTGHSRLKRPAGIRC